MGCPRCVLIGFGVWLAVGCGPGTLASEGGTTAEESYGDTGDGDGDSGDGDGDGDSGDGDGDGDTGDGDGDSGDGDGDGDLRSCDEIVPTEYATCDGTPQAPTADPFNAIGLACPGDWSDSVQLLGSNFVAADPDSWAVIAELGLAEDPNNPGLALWSPRPAWPPNFDGEDTPNSGNNMLMLSTGTIAAPDADGRLLEAEGAQASNGANANDDSDALPPGLSVELTFVNDTPISHAGLVEAGGYAYTDQDPALAGTGFEGHAATEWIMVRGSSAPLEQLSVTILLTDIGDDAVASAALIDNFRWECLEPQPW